MFLLSSKKNRFHYVMVAADWDMQWETTADTTDTISIKDSHVGLHLGNKVTLVKVT